MGVNAGRMPYIRLSRTHKGHQKLVLDSGSLIYMHPVGNTCATSSKGVGVGVKGLDLTGVIRDSGCTVSVEFGLHCCE